MTWRVFPECKTCTNEHGFDIVYTMSCFLGDHERLVLWIGEEE